MPRSLHGRPLLTNEIRVRVTPSLETRIRKYAMAEETSMSAQIRGLILDAIGWKDAQYKRGGKTL